MPDTSVVTARVKTADAERLDQLAAAYERTRGWHIARAIERYVAEEAQLLDMIHEGEADIAAGRTYSQEEVEAMFAIRTGGRDAA